MLKTVIFSLLCALVLSACAQGDNTQSAVPQSASAPSAPTPASVSSALQNTFVVDDEHSLFRKKDTADIESFKVVEFKESSLRKLGSNIGMQGNGQMALIDGQLLIYNAPNYLVETCSHIDLDTPFVYRVNPDTLEILDTLQISEKATVAFSKNNVLVMLADKIKRYNAKFELIDTFDSPSNAYSSGEEWWARRVLALDNDNIIYLMSQQATPNILNIVKGEVTVMPPFINGGKYSMFYTSTDSDIIGCYSYKPQFDFFVNWKTMEQIDAIDLSNSETVDKTALSMANLTLYEPPTETTGLLYVTKLNDAIYRKVDDTTLEIYDCVNEKQITIKDRKDKRFYLSSVLRAEDGRVFLLVYTSDRKATICETYLYRMD